MTRSRTSKYAYALLLTLAAAVLGEFLAPLIGYRAVGFLFLLSVIMIGMFGSLAVVILSAAMSGILWDYVFIPPRFAFSIGSLEDLLMVITFFLVATITGTLTHRIRRHEMIHKERETRTKILYEILEETSRYGKNSDFLKKVIARVGSLFDADCGVLLRSAGGGLGAREDHIYNFPLEGNELNDLHLPLRGISEEVGIFIFRARAKMKDLDLDQKALLDSVVGQLGLSLERHLLDRRLAEADRLEDSEHLHQTLLSSVSHEIRTPLTAILGYVHSLGSENLVRESVSARNAVVGLQEASERLNRVIGNLLDMSRLSSGVLSLKLEWHDFNDLLGVVVEKLKKPLKNRKISVDFIDTPVLVRIDFTLMEHAVSNIILNAILYTPPDTEIKISLKADAKRFLISVADQGLGIPEDAMAKLFDKFYRVPGSPTGGTGLGLSIVKSIVELHRGQISVKNLEPRGASFVIDLPLEDQPQLPDEVKS